MNPFGLDTTGLMVWGLVAHLVADWLLQNDWMARNKASLRHPAAWVHAGIHTAFLAFIFGALPGWVLGMAHLLIDTRKPVEWWSRLIRQTQPTGILVPNHADYARAATPEGGLLPKVAVVDIGMFVRFWNDQVWHIACIAIAALVVGNA